MPRPQTAGEAPYGTSPVTSCGQPRSFPGADVFQRPFELRVYAAAHLGLDLGGLKHLDMGDDAYALVYLAAGIFHHGRRTVYAHYRILPGAAVCELVIPVERPMHVISDMLTEWRLASTTMGASTLRWFSAGETMHGTHGP